MWPFCIGGISWCRFGVPLFHWCFTILWYSDCSARAPLYGYRCSVSVSVFRCSAGVPYSVVPCSGVPGFIVCPVVPFGSLLKRIKSVN